MKSICFSAIILLFLSLSCMSQPIGFKEKNVIVPDGKTVKVKELQVQLTNQGCIRAWVSDGDGKPLREKTFCNVLIQTKDSLYSLSEYALPINGLQFEITRMNPNGWKEDSLPSGACLVRIRKLPKP